MKVEVDRIAAAWEELVRIPVSHIAFETPTDSKPGLHIHVANKGDPYDISDDLPRYQHVPSHAP